MLRRINPFFKNPSGFFANLNKQSSLIFFLGIASGLPMSILYTTINYWLAHLGISTTSLGLISTATLPFLFKFLWAPLLDNIKVPYFAAKYGLQKSLIITLQTFLIITIIFLGFTHPEKNIYFTYLCLLIIAFLSASQNVVMDGYRIRLLTYAGQSAGSGVNILGYRVGWFISGYCIPTLADSAFLEPGEKGRNWELAFILGGVIAFLTWVVMLFLPKNYQKPNSDNSEKYIEKSSLRSAIKDFTQHSQWFLVLAFILTYRINHHFIIRMETKFWVDLGFSLTAIVKASSLFGLIPNMLGVILGAIFNYNLGLRKTLSLGLLLPLLGNFLLILQYKIGGNNFYLLYIYVGFSYLASGLGGAILITYLDILSKASKYTATLYAFFTSCYTLGKIFLPGLAGYIISYFGWLSFFYMGILLGLIPLIFLSFLKKEW